MRPDEFQDKLQSLTWADFEKFVVDVLCGTGRFRDVRQRVLVNSGMGYVREFDIEAIEVDAVGPIPPKWYFEVKKRALTSIDVVDSLLGKYHDLPHTNGPIRFAFVTSGSLTQAARHRSQSDGLEVWDSTTLANMATPEIMERYFGEGAQLTGSPQQNNRKSDLFLQALGSTPPGREFWSAYQHLGSEIFEYLFCPPLEPPRYNVPDSDSRNVRDMICENSTMTGFWALIRATYAAQYIVVDAKNYSDPIEKQPVLDIAHYLKSYGCGLFGILLTRKGANQAADHAIREQWIGAQKMIVVLSDSDVEEMLLIKSTGGRPEELIRKKIADFRMSL
jgi:Restriction endonuclease